MEVICIFLQHSWMHCRNIPGQKQQNRRNWIGLAGRNGKRRNPESAVPCRILQGNLWSFMQSARKKKVMSVDQIPSGSESLKRCFRMRKQKISWLRSKILRKIWRAPRLWTVLCVGMSDMARQRLRCELRLKQFRKAARLFILYRPRFLHSRFITPLFSEWKSFRWE